MAVFFALSTNLRNFVDMKKLIIVMVLMMLASCKTKYVSVPEYHTEYKFKTDSFYQKDTTWIHDSVSVFMLGDTVFKTRIQTKYGYRYIYKHLTDTIAKTDSVSVPYPVEQKLGWWQQARQRAFYPLVCLCFALCGLALWLVKRKS